MAGKEKSSMRDYSKMTDNEVKSLAFRHYTDDELKEMLDRGEQQIKNGQCIVLDNELLDDMFKSHYVRNTINR